MYKKILLPVDVFEMDLSDKAVRHAEFLASAENGEITLLNVLPNSSRSLLRGFTADIRKFEAYMKEESEKKNARGGATVRHPHDADPYPRSLWQRA
ncbi:Universal stress protein G [Klebsiella pneumoniae IS46]|uniref:Universal stress family protein n=2 Tax=Klebsiella pneumoniae TaxID=573 RepID=A0A377WMF5_KLEPN|nr:Universal stress protein G [Klebsiella pneumoniae IS46]STT54368.1 universal stress family protein [Klebsiella pneumoniae]